jgi:hypothetical protein
MAEEQNDQRPIDMELNELSVRDLKPVAQLSNQEIVAEARDLHTHFDQLRERYEQTPVSQRGAIREEMQPVVDRERELRQEFAGRNPELTRDRALEQEISYSR